MTQSPILYQVTVLRFTSTFARITFKQIASIMVLCTELTIKVMKEVIENATANLL